MAKPFAGVVAFFNEFSYEFANLFASRDLSGTPHSGRTWNEVHLQVLITTIRLYTVSRQSVGWIFHSFEEESPP